MFKRFYYNGINWFRFNMVNIFDGDIKMLPTSYCILETDTCSLQLILLVAGNKVSWETIKEKA